MATKFPVFDDAPEGTPRAGFVHLHVHSDYSLLDSCASLDKLVEKAKRLNMPALALTDHGNMFGALNFEKLCRVNGIKPIIGEEFYVAYGSHNEKNDVPFMKNSGPDAAKGKKSHYFHLILLCENQKGYENLSWLSSRAFCDENALYYSKPRIDFELLEQYHEGLICLTACIQGEIPQYLLNNEDEQAYEIARRYKALFGKDHFYLELQYHGIPEQKIIADKLVKMSRDLDIPLVLTNDVHYVEKEDAEAQEALRCIGFKTLLGEKNNKMGGESELDSWYFKTEQEMRSIFPELGEACDNTVKIADMCNLEIKQFKTQELKSCLPRFELPAEFRANASSGDADGYQKDQNAYLKHIVEEGLKKRYKEITPEIRERADYEMDTIFSMGFSGYFLIVWEFINWAKSPTDNLHGNAPKPQIPIGPGRGSGAGSLVAYAMEITDIDPFKYGLIFERFLNPERVSMPDFDIDMDYYYRKDIIQHTRDLYGDDCVGHIVTFGTLKAKNVITDVGRILDIPLNEVNMIKKALPDALDYSLKDAFTPPDEAHPMNGALLQYKDEPRFQKLFELARKLEGLKRQTGLHASGMVIGLTQLPNWAPVFRDSKTGEIAVQYTMDIIEPCGLVKFDYLGLKTLSLIRYAEEIINKHSDGKEKFSAQDVSETDEATFEMFGRGDTTAVFQFESVGMQKYMKQLKPTCMEDLVAMNALYRPGPMNYIPNFIEGKHDPSTVKYPDQSLEGLLKETYGVMVYQEQVMKVAQIIAGFSLGAADELRRAMGKKLKDVLASKKKDFEAGAMQKGYTKEHAAEIFDIMEPFAGYGFNKSHAAAYSVLAYRTAWLKCHYPAEFMAANLTNEIGTADKLPEYIEEARKMGIPINPPDINNSDIVFDVVDGKIVFGLTGIKGMGEAAAEHILSERAANGPYLSFIDFLQRINSRTITRHTLEVLIKSGAFDNLAQNRPTLLHNMERAIEYTEAIKKSKEEGQNSLFEGVGEKEFVDFVFEEVEDLPRMEKLNQEMEFIGIYVSGHPLDDYRKTIEKSVDLTSKNFDRAIKNETAILAAVPENSRWRLKRNSRLYTVIGIATKIHSIRTKKGEEMAFIDLQDYSGVISLTFFPKQWETIKTKISEGDIIAAKGQIDTERNMTVKVEELVDLNSLKERTISEVHIQMSVPDTPNAPAPTSETPILALRDFLFANQGQCSVYFHIATMKGNFIVKASPHLKIPCDKEFISALGEQSQVQEVWVA